MKPTAHLIKCCHCTEDVGIKEFFHIARLSKWKEIRSTGLDLEVQIETDVS